ncbi:MAG: DnaJ family domain-containing protein [Nitrospirota bacterium]
MDAIAKIAEEKIRTAMEEGAFDNLAGAGKPLHFEDETWVPEDLRLAYRVLRNAGCIPPDLEAKREIMNLKDLIDTIDDDKEKLKKLRELNFKILTFNIVRKRPLNLEDLPAYEQRLVDKITG